MMENVIIHFDGDRSRLVLTPAFLPAPRADLRKVLRYADQTGETEEVCRTFLRNLDRMIPEAEDALQCHRAAFEKTKMHYIIARVSLREARAMLKAEKDPAMRETIRESISGFSVDIERLKKQRSEELAEVGRNERDLEKLKKNREVIEGWQSRRK